MITSQVVTATQRYNGRAVAIVDRVESNRALARRAFLRFVQGLNLSGDNDSLVSSILAARDSYERTFYRMPELSWADCQWVIEQLQRLHVPRAPVPRWLRALWPWGWLYAPVGGGVWWKRGSIVKPLRWAPVWFLRLGAVRL